MSFSKFLPLYTGAKIPKIGLGTLVSGNKDTFVNAITKVGYRHIDTAAYHKNEQIIGNALKEVEEQGIQRQEIFLSTKMWQTDYEDPVKALEASLKKLQQEYVDLYYIHWPFNANDETGRAFKRIPMHRIWAGMEECVQQGLTKHIGVCNFNVQLIVDMLSYANIKPA